LGWRPKFASLRLSISSSALIVIRASSFSSCPFFASAKKGPFLLRQKVDTRNPSRFGAQSPRRRFLFIKNVTIFLAGKIGRRFYIILFELPALFSKFALD